MEPVEDQTSIGAMTMYASLMSQHPVWICDFW